MDKLFECVELFRVNEGLSEGENSSKGTQVQSTVTIELSCWREVDSHSTLVVVCSNDYIVIKATPANGAAVVRQLKWFETSPQHILDITMDRYGQWLACVCLDGALYLLPVVSLVLGQVPIFCFGELDDLTVILPSKKRAPPTCLAWWETMDNRHICITGSEAGELTFFDLNRHCDLLSIQFSSCIDSMQLAHKANWYTYLLINIRGGQWEHIMLEERLHEASKIHFNEASSLGFEVLSDDMVVKSLVGPKGDLNPAFKAQPVMSFNELTKLSSHDWKDSHFLGALNLKSHKFEVYHYEFDMTPNLINICQLVNRATNVIMADRLMFVISHNDDVNECTFNLNIMSWQRAVESSVQVSMSQAQAAVVQLFTIPSVGALVGFYPLHSYKGFEDSEDIGTLPPTRLGGCVVVTSTAVYQCRQMRSPESVFLELCLGSATPEKAESFAITYKLDICSLYQLAGQKKLADKKYSQALLLFDTAKCSTLEILQRFSKLGRMSELVQYLHRIVYQSETHGPKSGPKELQDLLIKCFVHQCLEIQDQYEAVAMSDKFIQFIRDQFLYNQTVALELLISCGLKEQVLELAKTHQKLSEALGLLIHYGSLCLNSSVQSSLSSRQYVESLTSVSEGVLLYLINSSTFVKFLVAMPSLIPHHMHYLRLLMPGLSIRTLVKLACLLDPYNPSICPLLKRAHSKRRNSTGSTVSSVASDGETEPSDSPHLLTSPTLETYIELFLSVLITLNQKRRTQSSDQSLSRSSSMLGQTYTKHLVALSEGSQVVQSNPLAAGLHHAAIVMDGILYTWGSNKNGKLGHGEEEERKSQPTRVETLYMLGRQVLAVSCGAEHTIAMCQDGLFSWGGSSHGQLGHGDRLNRTRPVQIGTLADKNVVSVVCGQYHCLALDGDQRVWSWGWGVHGQLGLQSTDDRLFPVHVSVLDYKEISFIAAGYGHSAVLTSKGEVLVFGNGMYGQLGLGNSEKQSCPVVVPGLQKRTVYLIGCGNFHTVAVCTDQSVYYWGKNLQRLNPPPSSQQGNNRRGRPNHSFHNTLANSFTPQLMSGTEFDDTVTQITCGGFHTMFLTAAGSVYACGKNQSGQLGLGPTTELLCPKKLPNFDRRKIMGIAAGDEFSLALDETQTPWVWGKTEHGQLGIDDRRQSLGTPVPNETLRLMHESSRGVESPDVTEPSLFALDMGWQLCDFAAFGSDHVPYGQEALCAALKCLHGFYRHTPIVHQLYLTQDWTALTTIYHDAQQWSQALECALLGCTSDNASASTAGEVIKTYMDLFVSANKNHHSYSFVMCGTQMMTCLFSYWKTRGFSFTLLEGILGEHLSTLAYILSLFVGHNPALASGVSIEFHMKVVKEVQCQIGSGLPKPSDIIMSSHSKDRKVVVEMSDRDERLWSEIRRNLFGSLHKGTSVHISEQTLASLEAQVKETPNHELHPPEAIVAFSCGHSFLESQFQTKIVPEFVERAHSFFPVPIHQTLKHLQSHYKQSQFYLCACPYCVFQYLRKEQLDTGTPPSNPIHPWNP